MLILKNCFLTRLEILEDLPLVDAVFVSVGGGGLISGIAAYMKNRNPDIKVILFLSNSSVLSD